MLSSLKSFVLPTVTDRRILKVQLALVIAMCLLLSLGYYGQREWRHFAEARQLPQLFDRWDGLAWFVWAGAAPAMLLLIHRFPLKRGELRRNFAGLALGSLLLYFVVANLRYCFRVLPNLWHSPAGDLPIDFPSYLNSNLVLLPGDFLTYCGFFAITFAVIYYFRFRQRAELAAQLQLKAARLEAELSQAELAALRSQLHPHFLFNSFNAVATLVRQKKNESAVEVIAQLSGLLRRALDRSVRATVTLENEMDFVRQYLEIEKVRFGDKLRFECNVDPATLRELVPNLILQPLVENAIKHGISQRVTSGSLSLVTRRTGDRVVVEVGDDGPELPLEGAAANVGSHGVGIANTRLRLEKFYGEDFIFEMKPRENGGMLVHLDLPWRPVPAGIEEGSR